MTGHQVAGNNVSGPTVGALLAEHLDAFVVFADSFGLSVPVPPTIPLRGQRVLAGRSLLEHVVSDDVASVAHAWNTAVATGRSEVAVRLISRPERPRRLYIEDVRDAYGVFIGLVFPDGDEPWVELSGGVEAPRGPPRYCSNQLSSSGAVVECDDNVVRLLQWSRDELIGTSSLDRIHPDDQARTIEGWTAMLATGRPQQMRVRHRCKDGTWVWLDTTLHNYLGQPDRDHVLAEMIDVSVEMAAQELLAAREQLLDRLAQALPVGLCQVDVSRAVVYSNERLHAIMGVTATADLNVLLGSVIAEHRSLFDATLTCVLELGEDADIEIDLCIGDTSELRRCLVSSRVLDDRDGVVTGAIVCVSDITESTRMRVELEARALELEDRATFDPLTRCHSRGSTIAAVEQAMADRGTTEVGAIFIDLDKFKRVNDLLGHAAGDELLSEAAERIRSVLRDDDMGGRIGGDEFLVVCRRVNRSDDVVAVARRIAAAFLDEVVLTTGAVDLRASLGVACSEPDMSADTLVARADEAMYESKRQGRGEPVVYTIDAGIPTALEVSHPR